MTDGEKMVWAATFALAYRKAIDLGPPRDAIHDGDRWQAWELNQAASAADIAWGAVDTLRALPPRVAEGFGDDSEVLQMLNEMLGSAP